MFHHGPQNDILNVLSQRLAQGLDNGICLITELLKLITELDKGLDNGIAGF